MTWAIVVVVAAAAGLNRFFLLSVLASNRSATSSSIFWSNINAPLSLYAFLNFLIYPTRGCSSTAVDNSTLFFHAEAWCWVVKRNTTSSRQRTLIIFYFWGVGF